MTKNTNRQLDVQDLNRIFCSNLNPAPMSPPSCSGLDWILWFSRRRFPTPPATTLFLSHPGTTRHLFLSSECNRRPSHLTSMALISISQLRFELLIHTTKSIRPMSVRVLNWVRPNYKTRAAERNTRRHIPLRIHISRYLACIQKCGYSDFDLVKVQTKPLATGLDPILVNPQHSRSPYLFRWLPRSVVLFTKFSSYFKFSVRLCVVIISTYAITTIPS